VIPLHAIPVLGAALASIGGMAVNYARRKWLESGAFTGPEEERFQAMGELLPLKWADAYVDAIRKLDQASAALTNYPVTSCATMLEYLNRFYYWKYRMDRLWYYHMIMVEYSAQVDTKFQEIERTWKEMERDLKLKGPTLFDDWTWHSDHCGDDCCTFPWNTLQIGSPTLTSTTADLGRMNLQPIQRPAPPRPAGGTPPPLPPRPPRRRG
jgi:hypothetical protein